MKGSEQHIASATEIRSNVIKALEYGLEKYAPEKDTGIIDAIKLRIDRLEEENISAWDIIHIFGNIKFGRDIEDDLALVLLDYRRDLGNSAGARRILCWDVDDVITLTKGCERPGSAALYVIPYPIQYESIPLRGSEKQIAWATKIRANVIEALEYALAYLQTSPQTYAPEMYNAIKSRIDRLGEENLHAGDFIGVFGTIDFGHNIKLRTLPLIPAMRELLLEQKKKQEEYRKLFKRSYCTDYLDYVCVDEMGKLFHPNYVTGHFRLLLERYGLRKIRFHDLRHSCASLLLSQGIAMKQIQDWLGHSTFATTADIYSHLDFSSKQESAAAIAQAFESRPAEEDVEEEIQEDEVQEEQSFGQGFDMTMGM